MPRFGSRCTIGPDSLAALQDVNLVDVPPIRGREDGFAAGTS
jgi:hypothetical protein